MSYDWHLAGRDDAEVQEFDGCGHTRTQSRNFTYNIMPMYYECLQELRSANGKNFADTFEGRRAGDLIEGFARGIAEMERYPDKYKVMNPKNGWGSYDTALDDLRVMLRECIEHPDWTFHVH